MNGKKAKLLRYLTRFEPAAIRAYVTKDGKPWRSVKKKSRIAKMQSRIAKMLGLDLETPKGTCYSTGPRKAYQDAKKSFYRSVS